MLFGFTGSTSTVLSLRKQWEERGGSEESTWKQSCASTQWTVLTCLPGLLSQLSRCCTATRSSLLSWEAGGKMPFACWYFFYQEVKRQDRVLSINVISSIKSSVVISLCQCVLVGFVSCTLEMWKRVQMGVHTLNTAVSVRLRCLSAAANMCLWLKFNILICRKRRDLHTASYYLVLSIQWWTL